MMAGGTGITPMLQVITAILREGTKIEMSLIFANKTEDDILLRTTIDKLVSMSGTPSPPPPSGCPEDFLLRCCDCVGYPPLLSCGSEVLRIESLMVGPLRANHVRA